MLMMIETNAARFLSISGLISNNKATEFEQTFRLAFSTLSDECISRYLSRDISREGHYYFFSLWKSDAALHKFMNSGEYQLMNGAFHALGSITQTLNGIVSDPEMIRTEIKN